MSDIDELLRELADDPQDYHRDGSAVLVLRHGADIELTVRQVPGAGLAIETGVGTKKYVPLNTYIQRDILRLPLLAKQIVRALERSWERRPARFIDGPAEESSSGRTEQLAHVTERLRERLLVAEPDVSHVIQLMGRAGHGKTALLEHLALELARGYQPDEHPQPILLPVDLLGRYVGTVDDAIAGTLNNTYVFPGLSQRDVTLCLQQGWVALALDGFDELVARIGVRDAFLRITELLDQLRGRGCIVLSARESFFELYQVTAGIRTYLEPKVGSFTTTVIKLRHWTDAQGEEVFRHLGSENPEHELRELLTAFEQDREIVFHPFFLTRLAQLWGQGERFAAVGQEKDALGRSKYVIDTLIQRESGEKWRSRDGSPLLTTHGHTAMLGSVSAEMWRSGAFRLDASELSLAAELGLTELALPSEVVQAALARAPNHALLLLRDQRYSFLHDNFLQYFLGVRLAGLLAKEDEYEVSEILGARELSPETVSWTVWAWSRLSKDLGPTVGFLNRIVSSRWESSTSTNLGLLCAKLLADRSAGEFVQVNSQVFVGDALAGARYFGVDFVECRFWQADLIGSVFRSCSFSRCSIGEILVDAATRFEECRWVDSLPSAVEVREGRSHFSPEEIRRVLGIHGADIVAEERDGTESPSLLGIQDNVVACVEKMVRKSERTCDIALEEYEQSAGAIVGSVAKLALKTGVLRKVTRETSGPHKTFVRFCVDRQKLLRGQVSETHDIAIDAFWKELRGRYPLK